MADRKCASHGEQLLGEIPTRIVGGRYGRIHPRPGQQVKLKREPENRHQNQAIRVEGQRSARIGYLPRQLADWLAELIDADKVRIEGSVPTAPVPETECRAGACPLVLSVFTPAGAEGPLVKREVHTGLDALHEAVRRPTSTPRATATPR